jgi:three-Cys-motif partner protein
MKTVKEWQNNLQPHSQAKVRLLRIYLKKYLHVLSNSFFSNIYLFDVFCGHGKYDDGGLGSPLVMVEEIQNVLSSSLTNKISYFCHYNDNNPEYIDKLKSIIDGYDVNDNVDICYSCFDYRRVLPDILCRLNKLSFSEKAFIFIDPWGYGDVRFSDIQSLLSSGKAEVLLFLPTQFMYRVESAGTPNSLKCFIDEITQYEDWPRSTSGIEFINKLKDAFKARLGDMYYVDTFIIKRDEGQFFCLFFFTSHIFGFQKMLESKWEIDNEEGRGWRYESEIGNLFSGEKSSITLKFEEELRNYLFHYQRTNIEVYNFILHKGHLPTHANEILRDWQDNGTLSVLTTAGQPVRKKAFYLSHKPSVEITLELQ